MRGKGRPVCVGLHPLPGILALGTPLRPRSPSLGAETYSLSPLPPPPYPPSSRCPGAGSRRDTGPDPCPSCPGSACSVLSGPGAQAGAQTPGAHPLPWVGMGLSPPSGLGQSVYQARKHWLPCSQQVPSTGTQAGQAGQLTAFCVGREHMGQLRWVGPPRFPRLWGVWHFIIILFGFWLRAWALEQDSLGSNPGSTTNSVIFHLKHHMTQFFHQRNAEVGAGYPGETLLHLCI